MCVNSPQEYIGKIVVIKLPYFNLQKSRICFKARPALIIGCENNQYPSDFTYLPISKASDKSKRHPHYDYEVSGQNC